MRTVLIAILTAVIGVVALAACGTDGDGGPVQPVVVVSTGILGDVVGNLVGSDAEVVVLMPPGTDPHDFAPSAQQAAALRDASAIVVNGLGFEEGLQRTVEAAEADGIPVVTAADAIEALPLADGDGAALDPHFFTDPARMRQAAAAIGEALADVVPALGDPSAAARIEGYLAELEALDAEVEGLLAAIPPERRVLVTNHEVLGYLADRYGFEVLGAIIPGGATLAEPSAAALAALAEAVRDRGVPAIFADTSAPSRLAAALAAEGAPVAVVELYSESLGEPGSGADTYLGMVRTNAQRIAAALG